jgi:cytidine deaminase
MPPVLRPFITHPLGHRVDDLIVAAREIRPRAYAPYSGFLVGAAVLTDDGRIHVGVNVECVDYVVTHAEESAFSAMRASGSLTPVMIVAVGAKGGFPSDAPVVSPCGNCRQKIYEWVRGQDRDIEIVVLDRSDGQIKLCSIREALPLSFG